MLSRPENLSENWLVSASEATYQNFIFNLPEDYFNYIVLDSQLDSQPVFPLTGNCLGETHLLGSSDHLNALRWFASVRTSSL